MTQISHFVLRYNGLNEFEYVRCYRRTVLSDWFGSNYELDVKLREEIRKKAFDLANKFRRSLSG